MKKEKYANLDNIFRTVPMAIVPIGPVLGQRMDHITTTYIWVLLLTVGFIGFTAGAIGEGLAFGRWEKGVTLGPIAPKAFIGKSNYHG